MLDRKPPRRREAALMLSMLLTPAAVLALVLGCWRLGSDLQWTGRFAISGGLFSHWQVWMVMAAALQAFASVLNRYGRGGRGEAMP